MLLGPVPACENCAAPILRADTGRVRRFCSDYCRVTAGRKAAGGFRNKSPARGADPTSCHELADLGYPRRLTWRVVAGPPIDPVNLAEIVTDEADRTRRFSNPAERTARSSPRPIPTGCRIVSAYFEDEEPRIGCGIRRVAIVAETRKHVTLQVPASGLRVRLKRELWASISRDTTGR